MSSKQNVCNIFEIELKYLCTIDFEKFSEIWKNSGETLYLENVWKLRIEISSHHCTFQIFGYWIEILSYHSTQKIFWNGIENYDTTELCEFLKIEIRNFFVSCHFYFFIPRHMENFLKLNANVSVPWYLKNFWIE